MQMLEMAAMNKNAPYCCHFCMEGWGGGTWGVAYRDSQLRCGLYVNVAVATCWLNYQLELLGTAYGPAVYWPCCWDEDVSICNLHVVQV